MALPERNRPRFPSMKPASAKPAAQRPAARPSIKPSRPFGSPQSSDADDAEPAAKPTRPALKRRVVRRSSPAIDDGTSRIFIRIGVAAVFGLIGLFSSGVGRHSRTGNEIYFDAAVKFDNSLDKQFASFSSMRQQASELPISGVTDPKLKEYHALVMQICDVAESGKATERMPALIARYQSLTDELNRNYGRR
jgi:hypothetical protein